MIFWERYIRNEEEYNDYACECHATMYDIDNVDEYMRERDISSCDEMPCKKGCPSMTLDDKVYKDDSTIGMCGEDHYQSHNHHHQSGSSILNEGRYPLNISVIICTYHPDPERMRRLFRALFSQSLRPHEIIVVTEHTPNRQYYPYIRFVVNSGKGLSGARNTGVAYATGEYIAFIDDDAIPSVGWLEDIVMTMHNAGIDVSGGPVIPYGLTRHIQWRASSIPQHLRWLIGCTGSEFKRPIGCNMIFRREVFNNNLFDSSLGKSGGTGYVAEETELILRLEDRCWLVLPSHVNGVVYHYVGPERLTGRYLLNRAWMEGRSKAHIHVGTAEYSTAMDILKHPTVLGLVVLFTVGCGYLVEKCSERLY